MRNLCFVACVVLLGCGKGLEDELQVSDDSEFLSSTGGTSTSATQGKAIAGLFVQEDPTLDVTKSPAENATAVKNQAQAAITCPGASVTLDSGTNTVTVNFGTACMLPKIGTVSGTATAQLTSPAAGTVTVAFTFTALTMNGKALTGTFSAKTTTGSSFTIDCALKSGTKSLTLAGATMTTDSDGNGVTLDGTGTVDDGSGPQTLTLSAVHHTFQACYADAGSLSISRTTKTRSGKTTSVTETLTFNAQTPTTGEVQAAINGGAGVMIKLPTYGSCGT